MMMVIYYTQQEMSHRRHVHLHILSVPKASAKVGPLVSFAPQYTMSRVTSKVRPDPHNDFITDPIKFVT